MNSSFAPIDKAIMQRLSKTVVEDQQFFTIKAKRFQKHLFFWDMRHFQFKGGIKDPLEPDLSR